VPSSSSPTRIVIADDQPIVRNGLKWLLQSDPAMVVVGETRPNARAVEVLSERQADVLLLRMPADGEAALRTLQEVGARARAVRTIVLAETVDSPHVERALELGARGIILKDSPAEVLLSSIRTVVAGKYWVDRGEVSNLAAGVERLAERRRLPKAFGLTSRELEIVRAVVGGSTNKEIALNFSISENTVKRHLSHIFNKLGASNRIELALFAAHHRLVQE
jgi:DNA-binding NarL/FixJ family response regulator